MSDDLFSLIERRKVLKQKLKLQRIAKDDCLEDMRETKREIAEIGKKISEVVS